MITHDTSLTCAIIGHLFGDYLLQSDWMAQNKKVPGPFGNTACVVHCAIWTFAVILFSSWHHAPHLFLVCAILFLTHYAQDRTHIIKFWMLRINCQPKFCEPPMAPWSLVVIDNTWHIVTLYMVWRFLV